MSDYVVLPIRLPKETYNVIRQQAFERRVSMAALIRVAVARYVKDDENNEYAPRSDRPSFDK